MKINKVSKVLLTLVFFLSVSSVFAQFPEDPDPVVDPEEAPLDPAPISDYLLPMLVLGVATAFLLLKKKATAKV
ncbi:hypothetical protein [Flavobacterium sp. SM2513]|uniref:hypothetical protein n=1 Tax=Flavobacterium sp. SM2513 TaxID=3424766 RepID=UPI003D7FB777